MRNPRWDILFEPIQVGPKLLRNRFYQVPHCNGAGSERPGMQAALREVKAEGGWAVVSTEECSIDPEDDSTPLVSARLWDADDVLNLAHMCERAHHHGALAAVELGYQGANATCFESRAVARAPSQIASMSEFPTTPAAMQAHDVDQLAELFAGAALRAVDAGFDIVYVYGGSDEVPAQFLLSRYNQRDDQYGGSLENRARCWLKCLARVRDAVGANCAVATRLSVDRGSCYLSLEDACAFVQLADDLVDLWDIKMGSLPNWGWDAGPSRFFPENYQADWLRTIKAHATKPVVGTGRFTDPDTMADAIRTGQLDIIGAARPSISDPYLPRKIEEGRVDDIRECIGCNICSARHILGQQFVCTQNATAGEEYRRGWHPEKFEPAKNADNDVLVVGAGPAGMEAAMILGKRGMRRVHLVEAQDDMGGIMRWIPQLPGLSEWGRVVNYRKIQIDKLKNVEFIPGTTLDAKGVAEYGAEIVVVATGSYWATDGLSGVTSQSIPGADASRYEHVLTPDQIMLEQKPVGATAVVYDCDGYFIGVSLAELLARRGCETTYVTPHARVAPYMHATGEAPDMMRLLRGLNVQLITNRVVLRIVPGAITMSDAFFEDEISELPTDSVVLVTQRLSDAALSQELGPLLDGTEIDLYAIGDCVAPRIVADTIFDAHRLAREIDSPNPNRPKPYLRERRVVRAAPTDTSQSIDPRVCA